MTVSDLYKRLQETHGRRESKRKIIKRVNNALLRNNPDPQIVPSTNESEHPKTEGPTGKASPAQEGILEVDKARTSQQKIKTDQTANPQKAKPEHTVGLKSGNNPGQKHERYSPQKSRREQMLEVLRESEARYKEKQQRQNVVGIGDHIIVLSGPFVGTCAQVRDLDYINSAALVELEGIAEQVWLNLNILTVQK